MASNSVSVTLPGSGSRLSVSVPAGEGRAATVCRIKRAVAAAGGPSPVQCRLSAEGGEDDVVVPAAVAVAERPARRLLWTLRVETMNDREPLNLRVKVDPTDSVLDLKFLLEEAGVGAGPEVQRLFLQSKHCPTLIPAADGTRLAETGAADGSLFRVQFWYPSERPGHGEVHRTVPSLVTEIEPGVRDMGTNFRRAVQRYGDGDCVGWRRYEADGVTVGPYVWQSYDQVGARVSHFGAGLRHLGVREGQSVGIMAPNRPEWLVAELACSTQSMVSVPLYDTLGPDAVKYILNHAEVRVVVVSPNQLAAVAKVAREVPTLQHVVLMDGNPSSSDARIRENAEAAGEVSHLFSGVEALGRASPLPDRLPGADDVLTICYTSGTTGMPKGAVITHGQMMAAVAGFYHRLPAHLDEVGDRVFSYLPLAHIYEKVTEAGALVRGFAIGYFQGDTTKLVEDVAELRPALFPGVPRVWQKVYDRISGQIADSGALSRWLANKAIANKSAQVAAGDSSPAALDFVLRKIADKFGGRLKMITTGAAPLSGKVYGFLRVALNTNAGEGYGLTETCAALSTTSLDDRVYGHVGTPVPCAEVKLVDVPDMDYLTTDRPCPRGEVWVRGPAVFSGYYKERAKTDEVLVDGWFRTGDVGMWREDGCLQIIDRAKNLFKLSQGEYIRPEHIEGVCKQSKYVANVFVHGTSTENYLVAVVVPDFEVLAGWAAAHGMAGATPEQLAADPRVAALVLKSMREAGEAAKLRGFEFAKKVHVVATDFADSGLMTPTFKLKRHDVRKFYAAAIDAMYAGDEAGIPSKL